ncbi:MAG: peptidoglycan-binding protein [Crocosphaera sp.]|nr:peptidoglycan-binding protein [Crocosphaera sp.]
MGYSLKIVQNTVLKKKPINSSELSDNEKHDIATGDYELHSWVDFDEDDNHWRVAFLNDRFHDSSTWLVYTGHVEIWKDDIMIRPLFPATSTLLKDYKPCGTAGLNGLDRQIIAVMNELSPGSLVDFSDLNISVAGPHVHPFVQAKAKHALAKAIQKGGRRLKLNSGYRTIAQQLLLYNHKQQGRCGQTLPVAVPGTSNHQSGLALDTPDWSFWKEILPDFGWRWFGLRDRVHFDFPGTHLGSHAIKAFQILWNRNNLNDQIKDDGQWGSQTQRRVNSSPVEGFGTSLNGFRGLRLTEPPFMEGEDVKKVQQALIDAGLSVGRTGADGQYGPATFAAVKEFQAREGLLVDGVVGSVTLRKLGILEL